jgi:hypothetical protein
MHHASANHTGTNAFINNDVDGPLLENYFNMIISIDDVINAFQDVIRNQ